MYDFKTQRLDESILDSRKRVRYSTGLVMGVDEFNQDQLYLMERDRLHQRSLHGYGIVSGLGVGVRQEPGEEPEVVVAPGLAVNPRGQSICVPQTQCADLNAWLSEHAGELAAGSPPFSPPVGSPDEVEIYVVLCARDCETDPVPILGDPCRTLEDATAPSRIADDFELALRTAPPDQLEEEMIRRLADFLRGLEITDAAGVFATPEEVAEALRDVFGFGSPPALGSPPELGPVGSPTPELQIHPDQAAAALNAAFQVWITEIRPLASGGVACRAPAVGCVLLARLELVVGGEDPEVVGDVTVDMSQSPFLLSSRVLQELSLGGVAGAAALGGGPFPIPFNFLEGPPEPPVPPEPPASPEPPAPSVAVLVNGIDINAAPASDLVALPGIGPSLADRIVEARTAGRFDVVDELDRVAGISDAVISRLRPLTGP